VTRLRVGGVDVDERVLVIAEIGNNHEGDAGRARELVAAAAETGVDAVKFQTFRTELFVSPLETARFEQLSGFRLDEAAFEALAAQARELGLLFLSTALDLESARFLEPFVDAFKIASGDNDFHALVEQVARTDRPVIVSTGLSDEDRVAAVVSAVEAARRDRERVDLGLLHCVSAYPAPADQLNLASIPHLAARFPHPVGWSDHALGIDAAPAAVALGARIVEKHFTLDGIESDFRDHALSAKPAEMRELVRRVREVEAMVGWPGKRVQPAEEPIAAVARRSAHAARALAAGSVIGTGDVVWLRPSGAFSPAEEDRILGRRVVRELRAGEQLAAGDVEP
jgi:N,N'-diacetyllegionaminate synthase